jgi:hypothetical protein
MWRLLVHAVRDYCRNLFQTLKKGWDKFWFTPTDPTTIAVIRILTGAAMVYVHLVTLGVVLDLIGSHAWVDMQAIDNVRSGKFLDDTGFRKRALEQNNQFLLQETRPPLYFSVYYYLPQQDWLILAVYGFFLLSMLTFTLGLFTRISNFLAWLGHLSYITRGFTIWFGMDSVLLMLSFYLLFTDSGATLSLDRLRKEWAKYRNQDDDRASWRELILAPAPPSWSANFVTRLIQVHMCIIYACAGLAKLQGGSWWAGTAVWITMMTEEFTLVDFQWLAQLGRHTWIWVSAIATAFTLFFEIAFPFLIWTRFWKPVLLISAVLLHGGIAVVMGLGAFGVAMLTGCLSFISPEGMRWFLNILLRREDKPNGDRLSGYARHEGERVSVPA